MSPLARRGLVLLVIALLAGLGTSLVLGTGDDDRKVVPGSGNPAKEGGDEVDPLAYTDERREALEAAAARGNAHVLYAKSPGGIRASVERTLRYEPIVKKVADEENVDAKTLEAMILLESAGRPAAVADPTLQGAVGLTQILAETGRSLLGMRTDPAGALRINRSIRRAVRKGRFKTAGRLRQRRRSIDQRYDPGASIEGAAKYLKFARGELDGRDDLAVASYHMGVGNLKQALKAYGDEDIPYAQLYFDTSPLHNEDAYRKLASLGDDSPTYLWRVQAAKDIIALYRRDKDQLRDLAGAHSRKNSAEEVLHPESETAHFESPDEIRAAFDARDIVPLPVTRLADAGIRVDPGMGSLAGRLKRSKKTYRGLRPEALAMLLYIGRGVKEISDTTPLILTSTVRDQTYQDQLLRTNREATAGFSLHTSGFAFDIERAYKSRSQALAFQFFLDRLQSYDLIAWVREPTAIHVTVASEAKQLVGKVG